MNDSKVPHGDLMQLGMLVYSINKRTQLNPHLKEAECFQILLSQHATDIAAVCVLEPHLISAFRMLTGGICFKMQLRKPQIVLPPNTCYIRLSRYAISR